MAKDSVERDWLSVPKRERVKLAIEAADELDLPDGAWWEWVAEYARVPSDELVDYLPKQGAGEGEGK